MSKDVACITPEKAEPASGAACADNSEVTEKGFLQLLPVEELVPLSQTLISPALARLLSLNTQTTPDPTPPPTGAAHDCPQRIAHDAFYSDQSALWNLQQIQEDHTVKEAGNGDNPKYSPKETRRLHIAPTPLDTSLIFQEAKDDLTVSTTSLKRSRVNAGILDSYAMQLSDGDGFDEQAEGFCAGQLVDRDNSSNSGDGGAGSGGGGTASSGARTLKRPRLVWTPQLHKRFVDAVSHLGIKNAVPKTIMQLMNVEGLTRENVASHLQKYRLYLRRVQQGSLFPNCGNSPTKSMLGPGLDHGHHLLIGSPPSPVPTTGGSDYVFSSSDIPAASHHHHARSAHLLSRPIDHLSHQHIPSPLLQPAAQHQLNQAVAVVRNPAILNLVPQLDPRHYTANTVSAPPVKKPAWPSIYASSLDMNAVHHMENHGVSAGRSSPPQQALSLFPH